MRDEARLPREALVEGKRPKGCGGLYPVPKLRMTGAALNSGGVWFYPCFRLLANCLALFLILIWEVTGLLKII